ncbi:MAG: VOC family protein [Prolixibacteraceae bacterium]|jgi:catechol 2,3-dioxygenase-like lactoylglutathione lyase family enzyme|nr:VOC family protein [Prolixibacteraceae bacterium]
MIHHIALSITDSEEIENFYEEVLSFTLKYKFSLFPGVSLEIFNTERAVDVYMMEKQDVLLEIFINPQKERKVFSHTCLLEKEAETTYQKAIQKKYKTRIRENHGHSTCFIWDRSGNMFEIKKTESL